MIIDLSELSDGFSSKLKVISFFLTIIKIKKKTKKLYIYEKKTKECPYLFTDLCLIQNFKVFKLYKKPQTNILFNPYNYTKELIKLKKENLIDNMENMKFNYIAKSTYRYFIPNKKIRKKIIDLNLPKNFISIHLRSTDRALNIKSFLTKIQFKEMIFDFQIDHMLKKLPNFIYKKTQINNVFIASDDKFYKEKFQKRFSTNTNVFFNKSKYKTSNFRQTSGIDFIIELFCLSKSNMIISTLGGAVPTTACLISKKKIKLYKWTNLFNHYYIFKVLIFMIFYTKRLKSIWFY